LSGKKIQANVLLLGIYKKPQELRSLINKRVDKRLKQGMVVEVKKLQRQGLSFKKLEQFGLEYRYISRYLQGKINYREMVNQLKNAVWRFSRRQITWFKRDKRIRWISNKKQAEKQIQNFLK
jgi:tRNA dimethylallyltransferase